MTFIKKNLAAFCKWHILPYAYLFLVRDIIHIWQTTVDENPLTIEKVEIAYWLLVLRTCFLVTGHKIVGVPFIQSLFVVHHQPIVLRYILSVRRCIIKIEYR